MRREGNQKRWSRRARRSGRPAGQRLFDALEPRVLLSAYGGEDVSSCAGITAHPFRALQPASASPATYVNYSGYTPGQIRKAYGFDQVSFSTGSKTTVPGDGRGQTIAIVDAYSHPYVNHDLASFDNRFALPAPPSFKVVNQWGGSTQPSVDAGWASEIALDVEWAHAVAPQANLLLVEANSDNLNDLLKAVDYARHAPGVSVVSMSWGGSEFYGENNYDWNFTTPHGHPGVTFVNASGDWGGSGAQWPATSPNILSVGGTSLYLQNSGGAYGRESGWSDTSGGASVYEGRPGYQGKLPGSDTTPPPQYSYSGGYQKGTHAAPVRSTPDVSYNADPDTGFAVYDSLAYQGVKGWQVVGGTSAGAPQWAALVAIANQGRSIRGVGSLDGPTGTLPALYGVYSAPKTTQYSNYQSVLHDVSGSGAYYDPATAGYDQVTGLGSPRAVQVALTLGAQPTVTVTSGGTTTTGSGTTVKPAAALLWGPLPAWRPRLHLPHIRPHKYGVGPNGPRVNPRAVASPGSTPTSDPGSDSAPPGPVGRGSASPQLEHPTPPDGQAPGQSLGQTAGPLPGSGAPVASLHNAEIADVAAVPAGPGLPAASVTSAAVAAVPAVPVRVPPVDASRFSTQAVAYYDSTAEAADGAADEQGADAATPAPAVPAAAGLLATVSGLEQRAAGGGAALSAVWGALSDSSLWGRLSSLVPAAPEADVSAVVRPPLAATALGLAPALWRQKLQDSRVWEMTAAVCLGVMLAGYWYTTAAAREAERMQLEAERHRRVREGWELAPVKAE